MKADPAVYDEIFDRYYDAVLRYCVCRLGETGISEDCTQEVFLILYKKIDTLDLAGSPAGWLYKTADNVMRNYRKATRNERNKISLDNEDIRDRMSVEDEDREISFMDILDDDEREIIGRYYINGEKIPDIARRYKTTPNVIYKKIRKIKDKIINAGYGNGVRK